MTRLQGRIVLSIAALAALTLTSGGARISAAPSAENPAKLIYAGWFGYTIPTPSFINSNFAFLESQPFDGLVAYLRTPDLSVNLSTGVMKNSAIGYETMMNVLSPMASLDFTHLTDNLGLVQGSTPPDFFDDWSVVAQNYANLARALKDSGLKGVCFDNEQYASPWGDYGGHLKYAASKSFAEYQAQARLRGKQVMEAMVAQFPDIVVLTLHGPYVSEPAAPEALQFPQWQSGNELLGPFFAGQMEGAGTTGCCMDGGEIYTLRSADEFLASYSWRRNDLPSDAVNCSFIPASLRTVWTGRSSISFGVYDCPFAGASMSATILRSTLANAMRQADKYVWFYAEAATYLLPPNSGGASSTWVDAISLARADVAASSPDPDPAPSEAPAAPSNLAASAVSPFAIDLSWNDNSSNESGFQIERKTVINGSWSLVATAQAGATYHRDGGLWSATGYVYRIRAVNASGASAYASEATATTPYVDEVIPAAPTNLTAAPASPFDIDLAWNDTSSNETGFQIERRTVINGSWALVTTCEAGTTSHRDGSLWSGTGYVYRIRAVNGGAASAYTSEVTVTTPLVNQAPAAPSNLTAAAVSPFDIDLAWTDNASNETGFQIERKTVINGTWAMVATAAADATSIRNGWLWSATAYVYRIRAVNASGVSAYSNEVTATTPYVSQQPAAPSDLTITLTGSDVELKWKDNSWNENGFSIERRRSGGSWSQIGWVPDNMTAYKDAARPKGTYYYRVLAFNGSGNSAHTNTVKVRVP